MAYSLHSHAVEETMRKLALLLAAFGCGDDNTTTPGDDDPTPTPTTFTVRVDNVVPFTVLKSGTVGTAPLGPGESVSISFTAGKGQAISFATMLGESNDWFFGPGVDGIPLFDDRGVPMSGNVTSYVKLWDAGTEIDQEPAVGAATAPKQPMPNFGDADPQPGVRELPMSIVLDTGATFMRPAVAAMIEATLTPGANRSFTLTIKNVSMSNTLMTSAGSMPIHLSPAAWSMHIVSAPLFSTGAPDRGLGLERIAEDGNPAQLGASLATKTGFHTPISPGVYLVHREPNRLYAIGQPDYGLGLERIAEDGDPAPLAAAITSELSTDTRASGAFAIPIGASAPGPAFSGSGYEVTVVGVPGDRLSFATMYGMSNDWFFASRPDGIALFDGNTARSGDVTADVALYDAGTELDEEIAIGPNVAPQQPAPNTGASDPNNLVRVPAYNVPTATHLRVTLTPR